MIGAGSIVLEGALVEDHAILAEGSVVHAGRRIPAGQVWAGNPAVFVRDATKAEVASAEGHAVDIAETAKEHAYEFLPASTAYLAAEKIGVTDKAVAAIMKNQADYEAGARAGAAGTPSTSSA